MKVCAGKDWHLGQKSANAGKLVMNYAVRGFGWCACLGLCTALQCALRGMVHLMHARRCARTPCLRPTRCRPVQSQVVMY